jgi:hypothetical protein
LRFIVFPVTWPDNVLTVPAEPDDVAEPDAAEAEAEADGAGTRRFARDNADAAADKSKGGSGLLGSSSAEVSDESVTWFCK